MEPLQIVLFHAVEKGDAVMQVYLLSLLCGKDLTSQFVQGDLLPFLLQDQHYLKHLIARHLDNDKHRLKQFVHSHTFEGHVNSSSLYPRLVH